MHQKLHLKLNKNFFQGSLLKELPLRETLSASLEGVNIDKP